MTESQKKTAVLVAAVLIIAPVVVIRARSALRGEQRQINWEEKMKVSREADAPAWYHDATCCGRLDASPTVPAVRLATIRMWGSLASHDQMIRNKQDYFPIRRALYQMGANCSVIEGVDDRVPGIEPGYGEVIEAAYLLHAGKVPASYVRGKDREFCMVLDVLPGSAAEEGGLHAGDLLLDVDGKGVLGSTPGNCEVFVQAALTVPAGSMVTFLVLRNGLPLDLKLKRREGRYGYHHQRVPVLDSETF
jgi:PDZ domain